MINTIWNTAQQMQIHDAAQRLNSKEYESAKAASQITRLEMQVEKLTLITHALWEIVKKDSSRTDEELVSLMTELDLQDGVLDGKVRKPAQKCSKCGRSYQEGRPSCIYCGNPNPTPFERL